MLTFFEQYDLLSRSGLFDAEYYAEHNPEVQAANLDPLLHYIEKGAREGRRPSEAFDVDFYLGQCGALGEQTDNALLHFLVRGAAQGLQPHRGRTEATTKPTEQLSSDSGICKIFVDIPQVSDGVVTSPVRGRLAISGWALARSGIAGIEIAIDGSHAISAHYGIARRDVAAAFPDWEDALSSGFTALIPPKALGNGHHRITIAARDRTGRTEEVEFSVEAEQSERAGPWSLRRRMSQSHIDLSTRLLSDLAWDPHFVLLMFLDGDEAMLAPARMTLASLRHQAFRGWRLVVAARGYGKASRAYFDRLLAGFEELSGQIEFVSPPGARRAAITTLASGRHPGPTWLALLDPGDELGCDALLELAVATGTNRDADFVYSDERRIDPVTQLVEPFFKPDWSPDLLLSINYIGRLWCATMQLLQRAGATLDELIAGGEYDLVLRCTELARGIAHLPLVLCERSLTPLDDDRSERSALERAMIRRGISGRIDAGCAPGLYRLKREVQSGALVSIIIPTRAARGLIKGCIDTLRRITAYRNFEIICVENIPARERRWKGWVRANADKVIAAAEPFNWSRFNNLGAAAAEGEFLLFLNDDIEIIDPGWLDSLLEHAQRPEIGVTGPLLLYPDRKIQHAGIFLAQLGQGRHAFRFAPEHEPGYFGLALTQRNVIAVTGACLLTTRHTFATLGGFDEAHDIINNDVDYCLKAWRHGLRTVFTPFAKLVHHEFASRGTHEEAYDVDSFNGQWRDIFLRGDPYFHPSLSKEHDDFSPELEPLQLICAGHPILASEAVRRILVVKLDHIGDCVTALPAIRRLKKHFPNARLTVLSAPTTRMVWSLEPAIDAVIGFEVFHARSGLGEKAVTEADLLDLRRRLEGERFDLAIDLRKSPDMRHVLQFTGAAFLAGFDHDGRFPFLDIALEWESDPNYVTKRAYIGDDLVNLVDAVGAACEADRSVILARPDGGKLARRMLSRRLVGVHPGVGNEMRQWPSAYFAALIDLLVADCAVNVALIGGADEAAIAAATLAAVQDPSAVWNLAGKVKLGELPALLAKCALFVGNNSGPQHIAAGLGVPTVGIHSGVVDAHEWGPMGPLAVALQRDMTCSPCYLQKPADCLRGLACLTGLLPGEVHRVCRRLLAPSRA
jgi:ADP-heptose:LPS heptosyltransferase/GT2 family glycosyltransferase